MMTYTEEAVTFQCQGDLLLGIISTPMKSSNLAVIIIVGGPQYRVGSHRQFTQLARATAEAGFTVLRFDVRGMGDSEGAIRDFKNITDDIKAARDYLISKQAHINKIVLWGLCDGATAALIYMHETKDEKIFGIGLLNPWIRSETTDKGPSNIPIKLYYLKRLKSKDFWLQLISGRFKISSLAEGVVNFYYLIESYISKKTSSEDANALDASYHYKVNTAWNQFKGNILLILSDRDLIADEFLVYFHTNKYLSNKERLTWLTVKNSNHTFSNTSSRQCVELETISWLKKMDLLLNE